MNPWRKHQLIIEVTFSHALTESEAASGLSLKLDGVVEALQSSPIWVDSRDVIINKLTVKRYSRVLGATKRRLRKKP